MSHSWVYFLIYLRKKSQECRVWQKETVCACSFSLSSGSWGNELQHSLSPALFPPHLRLDVTLTSASNNWRHNSLKTLCHWVWVILFKLRRWHFQQYVSISGMVIFCLLVAVHSLIYQCSCLTLSAHIFGWAKLCLKNGNMLITFLSWVIIMDNSCLVNIFAGLYSNILCSLM